MDFIPYELDILLTGLSQNTCYPFGLRLCVAVSEQPVNSSPYVEGEDCMTSTGFFHITFDFSM